jgi:hypothetical protein
LLVCLLGSERHDGVELGVHARDHRQMCVENLDRAHRARLDHGGEFVRGLSRQTLIGHPSLPRPVDELALDQQK